MCAGRSSAPVLGLRANATQLTLLVVVNALVGGMIGYTFVFTYIAACGATKAAANWFAGTWSDRYGHKPVLLIGWLIALPVPVMLILAPT